MMFSTPVVLNLLPTVFTMMRYLAIIALLFIGCRTSNINSPAPAETFIITVQYADPQAENKVLQILNCKTLLQGYNVSRPNIFLSELEASCTGLNESNTNALLQELTSTAGVSHVVFNPR